MTSKSSHNANLPVSLFCLLFSHQLVKDAVEVVAVLGRQGKDVPQLLHAPGVNARQKTD
jgi:hypothetical protein